MTNGHPAREEDFDLLALGALDPAEAQAIEAHIRACSDCSGKLAAARGRIAALSFAAPQVAPSAAVKERLMRQIRDTARAETQSSAAPVRGIVPPQPPRGARRSAWFAILAPAYALLFLATFYLWRQNVRLEREVNQFRSVMVTQQRELDETRNVAHLFEAQDTLKVSLAPMPGMPAGAVRVMYNEKMGLLMYDGWIAPPPEDKSYQLWVVPMEGQPISVGVFNPATSDTAHWMTKVPAGVAAKAFAVTLEPAGGMPEPTGPMVMEAPAS
ncbi:MAG: anti-sigma factor [Candidatus Acidiferrales bacterium]